MPLSEPQLDAWRAVLNTYARIVALVESAFAEGGLPPLAWYDVLWALRRAPDRRLRLSELADSLTVSRGGATKLVDRLAAQGLLEREACEGDRRGRYAVITPAGTELLRKMWPVYKRVLEAALTVDDAEAAAVANALAYPRTSSEFNSAADERTTSASARASSAGG